MINSIAKLASANLIGQVLSFLIMPIITRIHGPSSIGEYQFFTTVALLLAPLMSGSYSMIVLTSESKRKALLNLKIGMQYSILMLIIFLCIFPLIGFLLLNTRIEWFIKYIPIVLIFVYFTTNFQLIYSYLNNNQEYKTMASLTIGKSCLSNLLKIIFSFFSSNSISLILSIFLTELFQLCRVYVKENKNFFLKFKKRIFINEFKKNKSHIKYYSSYNFISILMNWFPILIVGYYYGSYYSGLVGLVFMVVNTPIYPFVTALQSICFGELAREREIDSYLKVYKKIFYISFFPSLIAGNILYFLGDKIFGIVFGEKWAEAGIYAFICFIPIALCLILSPIYNHLGVKMNMQKLFFKINFIIFIFSISASILLVKYEFDLIYFLISFSFFMSLNHLIIFLLTFINFLKKGLDWGGRVK